MILILHVPYTVIVNPIVVSPMPIAVVMVVLIIYRPSSVHIITNPTAIVIGTIVLVVFVVVVASSSAMMTMMAMMAMAFSVFSLPAVHAMVVIVIVIVVFLALLVIIVVVCHTTTDISFSSCPSP